MDFFHEASCDCLLEATPPTVLKWRAAKLPGAIARKLTEKVRGLSWKYSSSKFTVTVQAALGTSPSSTCAFFVCVALIVRGLVPCHQQNQLWKYSEGNACY